MATAIKPIDPPCDTTCEYPAGRMRAWLFWSLPALFFLYEFMLRVSPGVVENQLQSEFDVNAATFGFNMGMYYYAYAPMQLVVGLMLDRFGSRRPLALACIVCAAGAILFAVAESVGMLGSGRLLAGFGSAFAYVGTIYVASVWFPECRIALLAGVTAALGMAGAVLGETALGWVDTFLTWREVFWVFAVLALVISSCIWFIVPNRPDWFAYRVAKAQKMHSASVFSGLKYVLLSFRMWILGAAVGLLYLPVGVFAALWGNRFLETGMGMGTEEADSADAMLFIGAGIAAPLLGWLADYTGRQTLILRLCILLSLGCTIGMVTLSPDRTNWAFPLLFGVGFGVGAIVLAFPMAMAMSPHHARGAAIAFMNFFQMLLAGFGQWGIGLLLDYDQASVKGTYGLEDFRLAFLVLPVGLVVSLVLTLFVRDTRPCKV